MQRQTLLVCLLNAQGLSVSNEGICIRVSASTETNVGDALATIATAPLPALADILKRQEIRDVEKWDWTLSDRLFFESYASRQLNLTAARAWAGAAGAV